MNDAGDRPVALVTGSSRGIGAAIARALAADGMHVVVHCRTGLEAAEAVASEIRAAGGAAEVVAFDVADTSAVDTSVRDLMTRLGKIDVLVNNAGLSIDALILRMREDDWQRVLDVNLKGVFNCTKAVARAMVRARAGRIINISSIVGVTGNAGQAAYAAAKAGVIGFTKSIARELGGRGITANVVAPGYVETEMTDGIATTLRDQYQALIPLGRFGRPEDVAAAVCFLAARERDTSRGK